MVLSPTIPVKAQETTAEITEIGENNYNDTPIIETNGDGTRTLKFSQGVYLTSEEDGSVIASWFRDHTAKGEGNFIVIGYYLSNEPYDAFTFHSYLLSNKSFTLSTVHTGTTNGTIDTPKTVNEPCNYYNGVYYATLHSLSSSGKNYRFYSYGLINERQTDIYPYKDALKADIDNGNIDLSKDDYNEPNEASAVYNKSLDFASISADYKVKYTIEKNKDGHFEFITPDNAGIQFDWINRTDIDGAYVKFNLYGEYYDSFWSTTYINTYVTLTCDRKNDLTFLCKQKDMLSQAKEKCNGSKGYGFVVNYIYVQAFAKIDGTLYRSRIYKFDSDLVSDYGNADSEDDEWFPEITGGDSMPEEYEPDSENPDPEKTEPEPDKDDDTVVDTPVKYDPDVVINDDVTYLEAFKQFINVMKQGISYLGDFPALIAKVFSFIPPIFILFIGIGFAVALLLRFLGR